VPPQLGVQPAHPPRGRLDLGRRPVGADLDELGGALEPGERLGRVEQRRVLVGPEHHPRVERLHDQCAQPADDQHGL
jgi:hypothetical protein